jgi:hypothetical protein
MTDTNIDNYSVDDILSIFNLSEPTEFNVKDVANSLIAKMKSEDKPELETFFTQARDKVLEDLKNQDADKIEIRNEATESLNKLWEDAGFNDNTNKPIRYFGNASHVVAENKRELETNTVSSEPIIAIHIVNIDSQYRSNILPYSDNPLSNTFNTSFTFSLTNPINKAISFRLYSYQIPTSWYAFNARAGNTFFMYNGIIINIPDGNYTAASLVAAINTVAALNPATIGLQVSYNTSTNRISFTNNDLISGPITVIFFIQANVINYNNCGVFTLANFQTLGINTTLGWLMGFRTTPDATSGDMFLTINPGQTISADVPPDTYGPKYFVLSLEDYSNQRLSSGLYNITNIKNQATISIPDYYKTIQVACKLREGSLTAAQQYAINAVTSSSTVTNNSTGFNNKLSGPSSGAAFAVIPLSDINNIRPDPYVKFGADLNIYKRNYLAPTILERFNVRLTDDKGNLVNLYDNDWSFSLIVEERLN